MVAAARRGALDRRPQPPVARPRRPRHRRRAARVDVRGGRLARRSTVKYGRLAARRCSSATGGEALRGRIDEMPNEEYQRLLRASADELRERLPGSGRGRRELGALVGELDDDELLRAVPRPRRPRPRRPARRLPGDRRGDGPPLRGLRLHDQGLGAADRGPSRQPLGAAVRGAVERARRPSSAPTRATPGAASPPTRRGRSCAQARRERLRRVPVAPTEPPAVPAELGRAHNGEGVDPAGASAASSSTSTTMPPEVAARVVTVSPDVASSTNLGGWINRAGDLARRRPDRLVRRRHRHAGSLARDAHGQHIELGIAEGNLVGLLGELGATWSREGEPLLPIGTLYDPFVARALEPWSFGIYAGGQSILVGTPSGVTLGAGGRRAPVDHHARRSASSSRAASPGSRRSARTSSGRCSTRSRSSAARAGARPTSA